jgi:hypothetical protein
VSECGQTHVCVCNADGEAVWAQPIDVHYVTTSLRGWPSLIVEVWAQDSGGRNELAGYGVAHVPCAAGHYELDVPLWRPVDLKTSHTRFLGDIPGYIGQSFKGLGRAARGAFLGIWPRLHSDLNPSGACEMTNAKKLIYYPQDHTQACVCEYVYLCVHVCMCLCICICQCMYTCVCVCWCVICVYMFACVYAYVKICIHTCVYAYVVLWHTHTHLCVYAYVCVHAYTYTPYNTQDQKKLHSVGTWMLCVCVCVRVRIYAIYINT